MKIRQNPLVSNKENYNTMDQHVSLKTLPMSANPSQKVLIEPNKKTEPDHRSSKKNNKQNIPSIKHQLPQEQNRKTIQNTIKDLLKDKKDLFYYLESQKQFISILDNQDPNLKHLPKQRGKLTSSLTEKKKSRIDTHYGTKSKVNSNCKKFNQYHTQNDKNSNKKIKNSSVTVELVNSNQQNKSSQPSRISTKHYETISFDQVNTEITQKSSQKVFKNVLTQEKQPPKYCLVLTSPQKKKPKKFDRKKYNNEQSAYLMKYGQPNFSPWAFPKDSKHHDFDMIQMNTPRSSQNNNQILTFDKQLVEKNETKNNIKKFEESINQKAKKINFLSRSINANRKISTESQSKQSINKNQYVSSFNEIYEKKEQDNQVLKMENQKIKDHTNQTDKKQIQSKQRSILKSLDINKGKKNDLLKKQDGVNIMKSSQVVILNSQPGKVSQIFAPKSSLKYHMHPKRSLNKDFSFTNNQRKIFHTQIDDESVTQMKINMKQNENEIEQENQLIELKKTQQFLKQIIISKNNVSYLNNNTIQTHSKKQFIKLNTMTDEKNQNKLKSISAKHSAQIKFKTYNHLKSQCIFLDTAINFNQQKGQKVIIKHDSNNKNCQIDKENTGSQSQQVYYKKAKTSLDKPLHQNQVYQLISNSNTKYLTQASLSGFYMINDSKIRNQKSAFVRKKRHSTMLMKNRKNSQSNKSEGQRKRYSFSVQKQGLNRSDLSMLQQGKGFGIVNPLTKQLYKKYVSIVQKRN